MTGIALATLAVVLSCLLPLLLARAHWLEAVPRAGVVLWQAVALAAVLAAVGAMLVAPEEILRATHGDDGVRFGPALLVAALAAALGAGIILVRLLATTIRLGLDTRRRRARHHQLLELLETPDAQQRRVHVLAGPIPMAYCVPGRAGQAGKVVLSEPTVRALPQEQVDAVIEHERAHLRARHDLVREAFTALHVAFPTVVRSRAALQAVDQLLEMLADDAASSRTDTRALLTALESLGRTDERVQHRLRRLRAHGPAPAARAGLSTLAYLLAAAILAVPPVVLIWPWLVRAVGAASG